jgi:hypothetical protein
VGRPPGPIEIDAGVLWLYYPGDAANVLAVEGAVTYAGRRFGLTLRGGVSDEWMGSASARGRMVSVFARRAPIGAELLANLPVRFGTFRFSAGAVLALELARADGTTAAASAIAAEPALSARAAYRLESDRLVLSVGVGAEVAILRNDLVVSGVGTVARTPAFVLTPLASLGLRL